MVIETRDNGTLVHGEITEGAAGSLSLLRRTHEERRETHAEVARQLSGRPVRIITETADGFRFEA